MTNLSTETTTVKSSPHADGTTDVLIVGAGPTGLMAAALLLRCGIGVRIVDKSPTQAKESRAFGVQARSMELFESIGLSETLLDHGLQVSGAQIWVDGKRAAEIDFDDIGRRDTPYQSLLMVPQSEIEQILADDVARLGVKVEHGLEVTAISQSDDGVSLRAKSATGEAVEAHGRYLIGADGAHSLVRHALGLSFEGGAYAQTFMLADCKIDWPLDYDHFKLFVRGHALGIHLPLKGRDISRIMATDSHSSAGDGSIASQGSAAVSLEEVEAAFRHASGVDVKLSAATWTSHYRVHHRGVDRYRVGRVFVAGDAAHIHSPAGGQGMNTGLQDAANLAWKLALMLRGKPDPALLDTYHAERWPVGRKVLEATDKAFSLMTSQSGWVSGARNALLPVVAATISRVGTVRNRAFHFMSQLGIHYEKNDFLREADGKPMREGPAAGHRAPNAAIARRRDVFDLIGGYRFHVLALSRAPLGADEIARVSGDLKELEGIGLDLDTHLVAHSLIGRDERLVRAEASEVFAAYGVDGKTPQALYLIRPDGYVAWRAGNLDVRACRAFVEGRLGQASSAASEPSA